MAKIITIDQRTLCGETFGVLAEKVKHGTATPAEKLVFLEDALRMGETIDGFIQLAYNSLDIGGISLILAQYEKEGLIEKGDLPTFVVISRKQGEEGYGTGKITAVNGLSVKKESITDYPRLKALKPEAIDPSLTVTETITTTSLKSKKELLDMFAKGRIPAAYIDMFEKRETIKLSSDKRSADKIASTLAELKKEEEDK